MDEARERDGERTYLCIDLKTFYASVECIDRGLDPFLTKLVVADPTRGDTTICLAISPAMKALGVRNRCRIFEIPRGSSTSRPCRACGAIWRCRRASMASTCAT